MKRLILVAGLMACSSMGNTLHVEPINRDSQYRKWYRELEECSGLHGDYDRLTFYTTTDHLHNGHTFDAYWERESGSIVLRKPWERESVMHEMMHDLTQSTRHDPTYFNGRCGNLTRGEAI